MRRRIYVRRNEREEKGEEISQNTLEHAGLSYIGRW
jgi:hypothetical protein